MPTPRKSPVMWRDHGSPGGLRHRGRRHGSFSAGREGLFIDTERTRDEKYFLFSHAHATISICNCGGRNPGHKKKYVQSCPSLSRFLAELDHQTRVGILRRCLISLNLCEFEPPSDPSATGAQSGCCGHDLKTQKQNVGHFPGHQITFHFKGL